MFTYDEHVFTYKVFLVYLNVHVVGHHCCYSRCAYPVSLVIVAVVEACFM